MLRIVLPSLFVVIIASCAAVDYIQPNSYTSYQPLENTQQYLRKLCKIRNFSQSPFGGFISEESDGNFPSGRN